MTEPSSHIYNKVYEKDGEFKSGVTKQDSELSGINLEASIEAHGDGTRTGYTQGLELRIFGRIKRD